MRLIRTISLKSAVRYLINEVLLNPFVLLPIGLVLAFIGGFLLNEVPSTKSRISYFEQLQPMAAATSGQGAFIEGFVSDHNRTIHRQFTAYLREEYRSSGRTSRFAVVAHYTPPLLIEANSQTILVSNNDYVLDKTDVTVEEAAPTFSKGAVQTRGFVKGSPVLAVGRVAENGKEFVAEFLYAGTRADFVANLNRQVHVGLWYGGTFLLVGTLLTILGVGQFWLFLRGCVDLLITILGFRKLWYLCARKIRKRKLLAEKLRIKQLSRLKL